MQFQMVNIEQWKITILIIYVMTKPVSGVLRNIFYLDSTH